MNQTLPEGSLISYFSNLVKMHGGINLAQGLPTLDPPRELLYILSEIANEPVHQYPPGIGNKKLIDLLVDFYKKQISTSLQPDNFLITQGATEAITLIYLYILKTLNKSFSVLSFSPAYESYSNLPRHFGQHFFELDYDITENCKDLENIIERYVRQYNVKIFFIASPGNPYGKILSENTVRTIINTSTRLNCYVIFDAVYKEIYYDVPPYMPYDLLNNYVFYVNSFSKLLSITGWRVGYIITDVQNMKHLRQLHDYTGLCANSVMQEAIARYLEKFNMGKDYSQWVRRKIASAYQKFRNTLEELQFIVPPIDGGYFIWAKLPSKYTNSFEVALELYNKTGIATVPGIHFTPKGNQYLRFCIARNESELENAIKGLKEFFK